MKKFLYVLLALLIGFTVFFYASGYKVAVKNIPFTKKFVILVTKSKSLYIKTYGPYTNPFGKL